jgi:hypothetical protein
MEQRISIASVGYVTSPHTDKGRCSQSDEISVRVNTHKANRLSYAADSPIMCCGQCSMSAVGMKTHLTRSLMSCCCNREEKRNGAASAPVSTSKHYIAAPCALPCPCPIPPLPSPPVLSKYVHDGSIMPASNPAFRLWNRP